MSDAPLLFRFGESGTTRNRKGFSLVELLVATVILVIVVGILFAITQETSKVWTGTANRIEVFRSSRTAFDALTRMLSQATLNSYYDYFDSSGNASNSPSYNGTPFTYGRQSDLQFICGPSSAGSAPVLTGLTGVQTSTHSLFFLAPLGQSASSANLGMGGLLNACGFYIAYGPDPTRPSFVPSATRYRYRLMQFEQSSDALSIYVSGNKGTSKWFLPFIQSDVGSSAPSSTYVLAENVIALILLPKLSSQDESAADTAYGLSSPIGTALAPNYSYDSSTVGQGGTVNTTTGISQFPLLNSLNQLPPVIQVTMVVIDESSAIKLGNPTTPPDATVGLTVAPFTQAKNFQTDLNAMTAKLASSHISFRVFQSDVAIRGAKWTSSN